MLSVESGCFPDKLFKMMHLSVKRRVFTDELSFTDGLWVEPVVTIGLLLILVDDSG